MSDEHEIPEVAPETDEITEAEKSDLKLSSEKTEYNLEDKEDMERAKALFEKSTGIEIKVQNPTEKKGGAFSKNYIVYEVVGKDKNGEIKISRRYKEFDALRIKLKENWPGIFIPSIPEKKIQNNTNKDVITERLTFLDHFLKKCSNMEHIFYSEEMQIFLHSTGNSDEIIRNLTNIPKKSCLSLYNQYKALFEQYDKRIEESMKSSVLEKISKLKIPLKEVDTMRQTLKKMTKYRSEFKYLKVEFLKYLATETLIKTSEDSENKKSFIREYSDIEIKEDLKVLSSNLKILKRDLESFFLITNDLSSVYRVIGHCNGVVAETTKELAILKSSDKEEVSDGLFKKVKRETKITEVEKIKQENVEELESANKLHDLIILMLEKQEIPLILYVKNMGLANGILELAKRRRECLNREVDVLKEIQTACPNSIKK